MGESLPTKLKAIACKSLLVNGPNMLKNVLQRQL